MQSESIRLLTAALDGLAARQRAISANIANASTPGYKRMTVSFEDQLEGAKKGLAMEPKYETDKSPGGPDGNNVDNAVEVGHLTRVELTYQVLARAVAMESNQLRAAISGHA
jgi:flagellar basal-body rod protein FlgB